MVEIRMKPDLSLPSWERGLKSDYPGHDHLGDLVAPLVGAWIEIHLYMTYNLLFIVAPLVGAWIEIIGLYSVVNPCHVAPLVGAWIEIAIAVLTSGGTWCRSPRGSVD